MNKHRWLKILFVDISCIGMLFTMSIGSGYQMNEVLQGLAKADGNMHGITTNLLSCGRWMWIICPPLICSAMILKWEKENMYFKIHRYTFYKKWRYHQVNLLFKQLLLYTCLLFGIMGISTQTCIVENSMSILLLGIHIWLLEMFILWMNTLGINLMAIVFIIFLIESSLILIGSACNICDYWNFSVWSMYVRVNIHKIPIFLVIVCLIEVGVGSAFMRLSTLRKGE